MHAVTRPLEGDLALDDIAAADGTLFVRDGVGFAGRGVATHVEAGAAVDLLRSIPHDGPEGHGPVAIGCVPFRPGAPALLTVPEITVRADPDGSRWVTTVVGGGTPSGEGERLARMGREGPDRPRPCAAAWRIAPRTPVETYLAAVATVRDAVRAGALVKAVVARDIEITCDTPIDVHGVLARLRDSFGHSYRYSIDGLVGASPELLVEVEGTSVRSHPLAGTAARTGDPATDEAAAARLVASTKDQVEHRVVIDTVHDTLLPWCSYLDWEPEPGIVTVANVQHLGTMIEGQLSRPGPSVIELVRALSPTPALGGHPRAAALALLERVEGFDRGRYGGAVGWVDGDGDGTWAVAIRCAELSADRRSARLFAGGGIVAGSDPLAELAETQAKLQAMLNAIVRP